MVSDPFVSLASNILLQLSLDCFAPTWNPKPFSHGHQRLSDIRMRGRIVNVLDDHVRGMMFGRQHDWVFADFETAALLILPLHLRMCFPPNTSQTVAHMEADNSYVCSRDDPVHVKTITFVQFLTT